MARVGVRKRDFDQHIAAADAIRASRQRPDPESVISVAVLPVVAVLPLIAVLSIVAGERPLRRAKDGEQDERKVNPARAS